jgi:hypothetical protein
VDGLQHAGLAAAVAPKKHIDLCQIKQLYLFQVSYVIDMKAG